MQAAAGKRLHGATSTHMPQASRPPSDGPFSTHARIISINNLSCGCLPLLSVSVSVVWAAFTQDQTQPPPPPEEEYLELTKVERGFAARITRYMHTVTETDRYIRTYLAFVHWMEECIIPHFKAHGVLPAYEWKTVGHAEATQAAFGLPGQDIGSRLTVGPSAALPGLQGACLRKCTTKKGESIALYHGYVLDDRLFVRCPVALFTGVTGRFLTSDGEENRKKLSHIIVGSPCLAAAQINHDPPHATVRFSENPTLRTPPKCDAQGRVLKPGRVRHDYMKIVALTRRPTKEGEEEFINYGTGYWSTPQDKCVHCCLKLSIDVGKKVVSCVEPKCGSWWHVSCHEVSQKTRVPKGWRCECHSSETSGRLEGPPTDHSYSMSLTDDERKLLQKPVLDRLGLLEVDTAQLGTCMHESFFVTNALSRAPFTLTLTEKDRLAPGYWYLRPNEAPPVDLRVTREQRMIGWLDGLPDPQNDGKVAVQRCAYLVSDTRQTIAAVKRSNNVKGIAFRRYVFDRLGKDPWLYRILARHILPEGVADPVAIVESLRAAPSQVAFAQSDTLKQMLEKLKSKGVHPEHEGALKWWWQAELTKPEGMKSPPELFDILFRVMADMFQCHLILVHENGGLEEISPRLRHLIPGRRLELIKMFGHWQASAPIVRSLPKIILSSRIAQCQPSTIVSVPSTSGVVRQQLDVPLLSLCDSDLDSSDDDDDDDDDDDRHKITPYAPVMRQQTDVPLLSLCDSDLDSSDDNDDRPKITPFAPVVMRQQTGVPLLSLCDSDLDSSDDDDQHKVGFEFHLRTDMIIHDQDQVCPFDLRDQVPSLDQTHMTQGGTVHEEVILTTVCNKSIHPATEVFLDCTQTSQDATSCPTSPMRVLSQPLGKEGVEFLSSDLLTREGFSDSDLDDPGWDSCDSDFVGQSNLHGSRRIKGIEQQPFSLITVAQQKGKGKKKAEAQAVITRSGTDAALLVSRVWHPAIFDPPRDVELPPGKVRTKTEWIPPTGYSNVKEGLVLADHHTIKNCCFKAEVLTNTQLYPSEIGRSQLQTALLTTPHGLAAWRQKHTGKPIDLFWKERHALKATSVDGNGDKRKSHWRWSEAANPPRFLRADDFVFCVRCLATAIGVSRSTYDRWQGKWNGACASRELAQQNTATATANQMTPPPHGNLGHSSGHHQQSLAEKAFTGIVKTRGSHMPHLTDTIQLDGIHSREELFRYVREKIRGPIPNQPLPSDSTIERAIAAAHPGTHFITSRRTALGKCGQCTSYDDQLQKPDQPEVIKAEVRKAKQVHLTQQAGQRRVFYINNLIAAAGLERGDTSEHTGNRRDADQPQTDQPSEVSHDESRKAPYPGGLFSLVMDGMDQSKTNLPHMMREIKNSSILQQKVHVTGVLVSGHPERKAYALLNFPDVANDTNLNIECLQYVLKDLFESWPTGGRARPRHLALSLDNASTNKCRAFFNYLALLVSTDVFDTITVNYFMVGHGHNQIDQMFSRFATRLSREDAATLPQLIALLKKAYSAVILTCDAARLALSAMNQQAENFACPFKSTECLPVCPTNCTSTTLHEPRTACQFVGVSAKDLRDHYANHVELNVDQHTHQDEVMSLPALRCAHCDAPPYDAYLEGKDTELSGSKGKTLSFLKLQEQQQAHFAASPQCAEKVGPASAERPEKKESINVARRSELHVHHIKAVHDVATWLKRCTNPKGHLKDAPVKFSPVNKEVKYHKFHIDKDEAGNTRLRVRQLEARTPGRDYDADGYEKSAWTIWPKDFVVTDNPRYAVNSAIQEIYPKPAATKDEPTAWAKALEQYLGARPKWAETTSFLEHWRAWEDEAHRTLTQTASSEDGVTCDDCLSFSQRLAEIGSVSRKAKVDQAKELVKQKKKANLKAEHAVHLASECDAQGNGGPWWWEDEIERRQVLSRRSGAPDFPAVRSRATWQLNGDGSAAIAIHDLKKMRPIASLTNVDLKGDGTMYGIMYSDRTSHPFFVVQITQDRVFVEGSQEPVHFKYMDVATQKLGSMFKKHGSEALREICLKANIHFEAEGKLLPEDPPAALDPPPPASQLSTAARGRNKRSSREEPAAAAPPAPRLVGIELNPGPVPEPRTKPFQSEPSAATLDRISRALKQRMFLIESSELDALAREYQVLGTEGDVYTVQVSHTLSCTCPDKHLPCKHILFVKMRVLKVGRLGAAGGRYRSRSWDSLLYQVAHTSSELTTLFERAPRTDFVLAQPDVGAEDSVKEAYRKATASHPSSQPAVAAAMAPSESEVTRTGRPRQTSTGPDCGDCTICFEPLADSTPLVWCQATCGQNLHAACFSMWHDAKRKKAEAVTCPTCRTNWLLPIPPLIAVAPSAGFLNLAAHSQLELRRASEEELYAGYRTLDRKRAADSTSPPMGRPGKMPRHSVVTLPAPRLVGIELNPGPVRLDWDEALKLVFDYPTHPGDTARVEQWKRLKGQYGPNLVETLLWSGTGAGCCQSPNSWHKLLSLPENTTLAPSRRHVPSDEMWVLQQRFFFLVLVPQAHLSYTSADGRSISLKPSLLGRHPQIQHDIDRFQRGGFSRERHASSLKLLAPPICSVPSDLASTNLLSEVMMRPSDRSSMSKHCKLFGFTLPTPDRSCGLYALTQGKTQALRDLFNRAQMGHSRQEEASTDDPPSPAVFVTGLDLLRLSHGVREFCSSVLREHLSCLAEKHPPGTSEIMVDAVHGNRAPSGMGASAPQLYIKDTCAATAVVTPLHGEIADSSAVNVMLASSSGCALWVGLNLRALDHIKYELHQLMVDPRHEHNSNRLIRLMLDSGQLPTLVWQLPGMAVLSPAGEGAAHYVQTMGEGVVQEAINWTFTPDGLQTSLDAWDGLDIPLSQTNSGMATWFVLPILRLMDVYEVPLSSYFQRQLHDARRVVDAALAARPECHIFERTYSDQDPLEPFCGPVYDALLLSDPQPKWCQEEIRWKAIDGFCIWCLLRSPLIVGGEYRGIRYPPVQFHPPVDLDWRLHRPDLGLVENWFDLDLRLPNSSVCPKVRVHSQITLLHLHRRIASTCKIPCDQFYLMRGARLLHGAPEATLENLGITKDTTISLMLRVKGGQGNDDDEEMTDAPAAASSFPAPLQRSGRQSARPSYEEDNAVSDVNMAADQLDQFENEFEAVAHSSKAPPRQFVRASRRLTRSSCATPKIALRIQEQHDDGRYFVLLDNNQEVWVQASEVTRDLIEQWEEKNADQTSGDESDFEDEQSEEDAEEEEEEMAEVEPPRKRQKAVRLGPPPPPLPWRHFKERDPAIGEFTPWPEDLIAMAANLRWLPTRPEGQQERVQKNGFLAPGVHPAPFECFVAFGHFAKDGRAGHNSATSFRLKKIPFKKFAARITQPL